MLRGTLRTTHPPPKKNDQVAIINICLYTYIAADILSEYALFIHPGSLHNMCSVHCTRILYNYNRYNR